jgi:hypothetical protein
MIDRLLSDKKRLQGQAKEYAALLHSTEGALKYIEYLIEVVEQPELSIEELAKMTGADSIEIIKHDDSSGNNQASVSGDQGGSSQRADPA